MEGENAGPDEEHREYQSSWEVMSPEIVEIGEDSKSVTISSRDCGMNDVYVAVGKNDLDVVKWALDHAISPGARVFLVHVFPPITYISTPVGRLSRSQLTQEQVRFYVNKENNRRRNVLQKYIQLCTDAEVSVDTMLLESNSTAKAILDLIPVLKITYLVMGTKRPPASSFVVIKRKETNTTDKRRGQELSIPLSAHLRASPAASAKLQGGQNGEPKLLFSGFQQPRWRLASSAPRFSTSPRPARRLIKGTGKGEFVQKKAPEYCEVTIVYDGKKLTDSQKVVPSAVASDQRRRPEIATRQPERNFLDCICFSAKSD
ncbi:hypothetical protein RHGRI_024407 [Rhododendron griersonianum]|uniref:UspA domain-containing protein n=1 Tax=Rhododendron griersonianum TaxID=479676 RepID=A0AAV6J8A9_9ERIC|nr:hypothetical protein RHGRI_024407 [Rhododendron griersonianum]